MLFISDKEANMATRILLTLAGVIRLLGVAWIVISLLFVRSVENGVSRHIVDGSGIARGATFIAVALILALLAWVVSMGN
jgi:hypothetical protein